jgi:CRISPR system Cascade subunit CasC
LNFDQGDIIAMPNAPCFLQIHTLASYPATLLNRDDSGLAKRLPFGDDAVRTRISSQCLKRHWRTADDAWALKAIGSPMAVRSREIPERRLKPILDSAGVGSEETRAAAVKAMARLLYTPGKKDAPAISDRQALLIGNAEIDYLAKRLVDIVRQHREPVEVDKAIDAWFKRGDGKNNLSTMLGDRRGAIEAGLEAALFGRMVTSDPEANTDAAIHVAHAFTVHAEASESDYFTVVDDLKAEASESGAGGLFDTELTAGLFYGYVVVDIPGLVANLAEDTTLAGKVVEHLVHLIATVSPGAKKGSTAPYAFADLMLIESGRRQPRTLANAFRKPTKARVEDAGDRLSDYLGKVDRSYGGNEARRHLAVEPIALPRSELLDLDKMAAWARDQVASTKAG